MARNDVVLFGVVIAHYLQLKINPLNRVAIALLSPTITCRKLIKRGAKLQGCNFEHLKPGRLIGATRKRIAKLTAILVAQIITS